MANAWAAYTSNVLRDPWFGIIAAEDTLDAPTYSGFVAEATVEAEIVSGRVVPMGGAGGLELIAGGSTTDGQAFGLYVSRLTKVPGEALYLMEPAMAVAVVLGPAAVGEALLGFAATDLFVDFAINLSAAPDPATANLVGAGTFAFGNGGSASGPPATLLVEALGATHLRVQANVSTAATATVIGRRFHGFAQRT